MWLRLLEQRAPVTLFAADNEGIPSLIAEEWETITELISCWESVHETTLDISSDKSCVSMIISLII